MMRWAQLREAWEAFWFEPESALPIAVFRIAFGLLLMLEAAWLAPDLLTYFGPHALVSRATAQALMPGPRLNVLAWLPDTDASVIGFYSVYVCAIIGLTLGFRTRACAVLTYVGLTSLHHADSLIFNASDNLLRLDAFLLIFAPAGARLSLEALARGRTAAETLHAPWAQRLIQLQLCLMYLNAVGWKLDGQHWLDGTAVYYALQAAHYRGLPVPFVTTNLTSIQLLSWGTIALELALGILVWLRETRYPVLLAGVVFHLCLCYSMNLPFFEWVVLAPYVLFVQADDLRRLARRLGPPELLARFRAGALQEPPAR
ncbi:MAG TPA: HTTM domain-containing protein [Oscillatoriaceae cyanobacterium]